MKDLFNSIFGNNNDEPSTGDETISQFDPDPKYGDMSRYENSGVSRKVGETDFDYMDRVDTILDGDRFPKS